MSLNWADKPHAEDPKLFDDKEIVWFNITDFLGHMSYPWIIDPNNLTRKSEQKVADAKTHFESGGWMDPVDIQRMEDIRLVVEGRHRLVAAIQLGETYAPFSVPHSLAGDLKSVIDVRSL